MSEADTRTRLIDPAIHARGWTEDLIRREETAGGVELIDGRPRRQSRGRADYVLRVRVNTGTQPVALAVIEAKAEHLPATHGLEQGKGYALSRRLNVPFVFASNGYLFVEYDRFTGLTSVERPLAEFPTPAELRTRYEAGMGFTLDDPAAKPLLTRYAGGEAGRRYYQDAAIRAVFERIARGEKRVLLSLATGAGKTFIAVNLLRRLADAGQLRKALFVCDRDELRAQASAAFQNVFGADAAPVGRASGGGNTARNARIHVATYQSLGVESDGADASFLATHYPEDYFSHIIIDECHRSGFGTWFEVLRRNSNGVQIGLTATPRQLEIREPTEEAREDARLRADNFEYFGQPVYEYEMGQGIEDGYLAACEIIRRDIFLNSKDQSERETGLVRQDLEGKAISDARTGRRLTIHEARARYEARSFEERLLIPDRMDAMTSDLFSLLLATGSPEQKTIVFCASDRHADEVANRLNNLYASWCAQQGRARAEPYAFKCTAASGGNDFLPDLRGSSRHHFVATTVDLLTTGVDVPIVRNVVFFKYVKSPISFYQMVGRGTRLDAPSGKLMFRVYDYTNATRLFGTLDTHRFRPRSEPEEKRPSKPNTREDEPRERTLRVEGFEVRVTDAGRYILTTEEGRAMPVTVEEYRERLAAALIAQIPTLEEFRRLWVVPRERRELMAEMPDGGRAPLLVRALEERDGFDLYDVLTDLAYGSNPLSRPQRGNAFAYKHEPWLAEMPPQAGATLKALVGQFVRSGTDGLENPKVFQIPDVIRAGGLKALGFIGSPGEVLQETKIRLFAA